jgi:hypothetical protein
VTKFRRRHIRFVKVQNDPRRTTVIGENKEKVLPHSMHEESKIHSGSQKVWSTTHLIMIILWVTKRSESATELNHLARLAKKQQTGINFLSRKKLKNRKLLWLKNAQ